MSETLYRKSWEPLSEADKNSRQVVRDKSFPEKISTCYPSQVGWRWCHGRQNLLPGYDANYHAFEFLCLTPVTPEDKG